ncbi:helix-turn-helix domain-containing protein [Paenibacillus provencensis]|uniref:Helix-turn-helix domain-containing protein n=1 Tax=Paenibacillus provencensis TaxID=441151 RepID=A0ABW3PN93_9BACL
MNPVVKNIETTRKRKRITMKEIADHCGKTIPWYADIAKGRRRVYLDDMLKIAEALDEDPQIFFAQQLSVTLNSTKTA